MDTQTRIRIAKAKAAAKLKLLDLTDNKDTYFVDAINYLKSNKQEASLVILELAYQKAKIEKHLNQIGKEIINSKGTPSEVAKIIHFYNNLNNKQVPSGNNLFSGFQNELAAGMKSLKKCITEKIDIDNAIHREDIGAISLKYGKVGNPENNFKGGFGISHIIAKREHEQKGEGLKTAEKLIEVALLGQIIRAVKAKETVHIEKDGYEVVLSLNWNGNKVNWILTGYKIK
jgi:dsDNA-binding SOS-regulon protein